MFMPDIYGRHHRMTSIGQGTNHMNYRKAIPILLTFPTALAAALLLAAAPEATGQTCQPPQWVTDLGVPIASRQTCYNPDRSYQVCTSFGTAGNGPGTCMNYPAAPAPAPGGLLPINPPVPGAPPNQP
jgi:hypothetical protein